MNARASPDTAVRFLLGRELRALEGVDPNLTVLEYLRTVEHRTGTKEGCAEGDCGACTVVLGELTPAGMRYRAVNSCLMFVPVLDGKQLITVEDLAAPDGQLHPAQQAMVDCHASQCGFCTPGFVMSLYAHYRSGGLPTRVAIDEALAGNLCRCTGYRPIVAAARRMGELPAPEAFDAAPELAALARSDTLAIEHHGRRFYAPRTVAALAELSVRHPDARLFAGGTDAGLWVTKQHRDLETLIHLGEVAALREARVEQGCLEIGGALSYSDGLAAVDEHFPAFAAMVRRIGSVQIRNLGTFAGNVANASPIGDTPPVLIALDAQAVLRRGERRRGVALDEFFSAYRETVLEPGEFIESLRLPLLTRGERLWVWKVSKRFDQDISAVCGAFKLRLVDGRVDTIRIAFGGMAATPARTRHCEQALLGRTWRESTIEAAADALEEDYQPIDDMRASGVYRLRVARNLLRKLWLESSGQSPSINLGSPAHE